MLSDTIFFFSSRRRHTRWPRDWSSDVCSSDLKAVLECMLDGLSMKAIGQHMGLSRSHIYNIKESIIEQIEHFGHNGHRSEERRVGKEYRTRNTRYQYKEKIRQMKEDDGRLNVD